MEGQDVMNRYQSGLRVRITKDEGTTGLMIAPKNLEARGVDKIGVVTGYVPGHGGDVWWVRHDDGSVGAYVFTEFEEVA